MMMRISTQHLVHVAAMVMAVLWQGSSGCPPHADDGPTEDPAPRPVQNCDVRTQNVSSTINVTFNKPANCPLALSPPAYIPYAANFELPSSAYQRDFYHVELKTWKGFVRGASVQTQWSDGVGTYLVNASGTIQLGLDGVDSWNQGYDEVSNRFMRSDGQYAYVWKRLSYRLGQPTNSIVAPSAVMPSQEYTVTATTDDWRLSGPVTWTWYVNGLYHAAGGPSTTLTAGAQPGHSQHIEVVASDSYGNSVSGSTYVLVQSSGCTPTNCENDQ